MSVCVSVHPLTPERFADLEALFAQKGCSFARGCWCMDYRISGKPRPPEGVGPAAFKKSLLRQLTERDPAPGLVGYDSEQRPVGWVTLGPRETFERLKRSPVMKPVDGRPVWSIVCFVVPGPLRGQGIARTLLQHAIGYARDHGVRTLEAYPVDKPERAQPQWLWHGAKSMFDRAGFVEVARRKPERPVMRLELRDGSRTG